MKEKVDRSINRIDAPEKTGGYTEYIADMKFEGMLYAKTLRSEKPRAVIKSIDIPLLPEGCYVVDKNDVPGKNRVKMLLDDQPFFAEDNVNYIGEPILLVVGPDREQVAQVLSNIRVQYEEMEPVFTIEDAVKGFNVPIYGEDNCFSGYEITRGDPDRAFREAAEAIEGEYRTGLQEHIYLEPQGVIGVYENERVTVYGSMQCPYYIKTALVQGFGWDEERIRVVQTTTGGAFGGKEEYTSIIAGHAAFAAVKTGRPVRLIFDRAEDIICTTKRHPSIIKIKTALDKNRKITAMEVEITLDGGAYAGLSPVVLQRAMFAATGVYNILNIKVKGRVFATNNVPSGAMRGFGGPQAFFAIEMHMQSLAESISRDPLDFKMENMLSKGDLTVTGGVLRYEVKLPQMIDLVERMSGYRKKYEAFINDRGEVPKGIGLSIFYHGCAFTGSGEKEKIRARVKLKKRKDGKVLILVASVEMGQGSSTTLRKIVARAMDLPVEDVIYENPDTDIVPDSGPTVASRTVMIVGFLLKKAAERLKAVLEKAADFKVREANEGPAELKVTEANEGPDELKVTEACEGPAEFEVTEEYEEPGYIKWDQEKFEGDAYPTYSWGVNVVEVEVDPVTFVIKVNGIWGVYDIGTIIDERIIRGQMEGGIAQGLGYAAFEVMNTDCGNILQPSLADYIIPNSKEFPEMEIRLIDNPYEYGPFGAKGAGELPFIGAAPAFASAVQNALKVPIERIPVTPEYLLKVVEGEK